MKRTILIIDDSEIVLGVAQAILEGAGYNVVTHSRATGSVALILQIKPDLVLLDVNMPSVRGDMVARMSSATRLANDTIVLLHSTLEEGELKRLSSECGAHGYLRKTNNPHAFLRQVAGFLNEKESGSHRVIATRPRSVYNGPESEATPRSGERARGGLVLLISRDMAEMSQLRKVVQDTGFRPEFALSAQQGIEKLQADPIPALVIVSADLPPPGVQMIFDAAVRRDRNFRERTVLLASTETTLEYPSGFAGSVLSRPILRGALEKLLNQLAMPVTPRINEA
jgi:CheY-like chemotaxis protein